MTNGTWSLYCAGACLSNSLLKNLIPLSVADELSRLEVPTIVIGALSCRRNALLGPTVVGVWSIGVVPKLIGNIPWGRLVSPGATAVKAPCSVAPSVVIGRTP